MWDSLLDLLWLVGEILGNWPIKKESLPPLELHNTLSGKTEVFESLNGVVKIYNCGPTVYETQHIGNLRGPLLANTLRRALEAWGYRIKHVSNITDVGHLVSDGDEGEDKLEVSAKKHGLKAQEVATKITHEFFTDLDQLGIDRSKIIFTPATKYIPEQIALVQTLEEKGYTYQIEDGVYFNTAKFPNYGKLGHINLAGLKDGARVEENPEKKNPHDFALWKFSKKDQLREQEWESPWGVGFPGWHIECTAMIFKLLSKQIDIHIGGIDLIPIHHNNEIAQAEAATGKQFVRDWMHNEFITIEGKKISKSLGNTVYLHNIVDRGLNPRALRYWFLTGHYRTPMNFTWDALEGADTALSRLTRTFLELGGKSVSLHSPSPSDRSSFQKTDSSVPISDFLSDFYAAIANDLDTPKAIARTWEFVKDDTVSPAAKRASLIEADKILGLGFTETSTASRHLAVVETDDLPDEVQNLVKQREEARQNKDFAKADALRLQIEQAGFELKDTSEGPQITAK